MPRESRACALVHRLLAREGMTRRAVLVSLVLTGCVASPGVGEPLDEDVHYIGVPTDFASAVECLVPSTAAPGRLCSFALTLCHNGRAALRIGDVVMGGIYAMDGTIARGTIEASDLALDLETLAEPEGPIVRGVRWELDAHRRSRTAIYDALGCD